MIPLYNHSFFTQHSVVYPCLYFPRLYFVCSHVCPCLHGVYVQASSPSLGSWARSWNWYSMEVFHGLHQPCCLLIATVLTSLRAAQKFSLWGESFSLEPWTANLSPSSLWSLPPKNTFLPGLAWRLLGVPECVFCFLGRELLMSQGLPWLPTLFLPKS